MNSIGVDRSLLVVHAHPDDESIFTGATMAKYAAEGTRVTLVTCTMGERGPVPETHPAVRGRPLPPGESRMAMIGKIRADELKSACAELGVTEHWYLGGSGRWHDSGVKDSDDPRAFCRADLNEAADQLAAVIQKVQPQVIVTYDANGFYGHPDHIQAHHVAWHAYQQTCDPMLTKFYALTMPRSVLADVINEGLQYRSDGREQKRATADSFPQIGLPDNQVGTEICADSFLSAKLAALKAHATQIVVDGPFFLAAGLAWMRALGTEYYTLLSPSCPETTGSLGGEREADLFCGM